MKTPVAFLFLAASLIAPAFGAGEPAPANEHPWYESLLSGKKAKLRMVAVYEATPDGGSVARPAADRPVTYTLRVAPFQEEGDAIAGITRPLSENLRPVIERTLAAEGFAVADGGVAPQLLVVVHQGYLNVVNRGMFEGRHAAGFSRRLSPDLDARLTNIQARLGLVGGRRYAARIADDLALQTHGVAVTSFDPTYQDILQEAREDRYYAVVSVYDFAALRENAARLLWQVKLSVSSPGVSARDAVPTMLANCGHLLGRDSDTPRFFSRPLLRDGVVPPPASPSPEYVDPAVEDDVDRLIRSGLAGEGAAAGLSSGR